MRIRLHLLLAFLAEGSNNAFADLSQLKEGKYRNPTTRKESGEGNVSVSSVFFYSHSAPTQTYFRSWNLRLAFGLAILTNPPCEWGFLRGLKNLMKLVCIVLYNLKITGLFMYAGTFFCLQSRIELRTGSTQEDLCNGFHAIQSSDVWLCQLP